MSFFRLVFRSLVHNRRMHMAVALGVIAASAVLTGSLIVGDSMRYNLRQLTLDRLGPVDSALVADCFFGPDLLNYQSGDNATSNALVPMIMVRAAIENPEPQPDQEPNRRANRVTLYGCEAGGPLFDSPDFELTDDEITINRPLADQLGVTQPGGDLLVRIPAPGSVPGDSPLGDRSDTIRRARLTVRAIVPAEGIGRFALKPDQNEPLNAWVSRVFLHDRLDLEHNDSVNMILVTSDDPNTPLAEEVFEQIRQSIQPTLSDCGLKVSGPQQAADTEIAYQDITYDQMIFSDAIRDELLASLEDRAVTPMMTYLVNSIRADENADSGTDGIPYSTVAAIDLDESTYLTGSDGQHINAIPDNQIVLNRWAADDLDVKPGDVVEMDWFEPETTDGEPSETTQRFRVYAICEMTGLGIDGGLTPEVKGLTDQLTIGDWDPPFPFEADRIRDRDENYWDEFRATPKAFVNRATGQRLWRSRFGDVTSLRVFYDVNPTDGSDVIDLATVIESSVSPQRFGFQLIPLKRLGLEASSGTTPFNVLFVSFSFFIIAAAVMLVGLLFRLGLERRIVELGLLSAVGFERRRIARLFLYEGLTLTLIAGAFGSLLGIGYAWIMNYGLMHWWSGAVGMPVMETHVTVTSLIFGYLISTVIASLAIMQVVRSTAKISVRSMLSGSTDSEIGVRSGMAGTHRGRQWVTNAVILTTAVLFGIGTTLVGEEMQAGAFFGVGAVTLIALLYMIHSSLRNAGSRVTRSATKCRGIASHGLLALALRNMARSPGRSSLCVGLIGATSFLIISISAFHMDPTGSRPSLHSGDGGFSFVGESDMPIYDLSSEDGRYELGFPDSEEQSLIPHRVYSLRVLQGDNASCLNLYQPVRPRVLGVPNDLIASNGFSWSATLADDDATRENPWVLLQRPMEPDEDGTPRIPVAVEKNTANYALHMYTPGGTIDTVDDAGRPVQLVVIGLLNNGLFHGDLLTSEQILLEHYPSISGYQYFLFDTGCRIAVGLSPGSGGTLKERNSRLIETYDSTLSDYGFVTETTGDRIAGVLVVQNTYLSTFQSLGGLGLILGTFGLAAVQLRNILERRGELALMRAVGFTPARLAAMTMAENGFLLLTGLATGLFAAFIALLPHLLSDRASIPWASLSVTLLLVLAVGVIAGLIAVIRVTRVDILPALRGD